MLRPGRKSLPLLGVFLRSMMIFLRTATKTGDLASDKAFLMLERQISKILADALQFRIAPSMFPSDRVFHLFILVNALITLHQDGAFQTDDVLAEFHRVLTSRRSLKKLVHASCGQYECVTLLGRPLTDSSFYNGMVTFYDERGASFLFLARSIQSEVTNAISRLKADSAAKKVWDDRGPKADHSIHEPRTPTEPATRALETPHEQVQHGLHGQHEEHEQAAGIIEDYYDIFSADFYAPYLTDMDLYFPAGASILSTPVGRASHDATPDTVPSLPRTPQLGQTPAEEPQSAQPFSYSTECLLPADTASYGDFFGSDLSVLNYSHSISSVSGSPVGCVSSSVPSDHGASPALAPAQPSPRFERTLSALTVSDNLAYESLKSRILHPPELPDNPLAKKKGARRAKAVQPAIAKK